uniref:Selenoprotein K n=1 Tax=Mola mola TaxID=94237 RepID=A0A3Q3X7K0_MOLML
MVYVSNGQVLDGRSQAPWGLSYLVDLFWGAVEFISLFFRTMINPDMTKNGKSGSLSYSDGRG